MATEINDFTYSGAQGSSQWPASTQSSPEPAQPATQPLLLDFAIFAASHVTLRRHCPDSVQATLASISN